MATHPPLPVRIKRIEPGWQGDFEVRPAPQHSASSNEAVAGFATTDSPKAFDQSSLDDAINHMGQPGDAHIHRAQQLITQIEPRIYEAAHDAFSARALVYGLLLERNDPSLRQQQLAHLQQHAKPQVFIHLQQLIGRLESLPAQQELPLLELCIPALKNLSVQQLPQFKRNVIALIRADKKVSLKEWAYYRILTQNLEAKNVTACNKTLAQLSTACEEVLSLIAHTGTEPKRAFEQARDIVQLSDLSIRPNIGIQLPTVDAALAQLRQLKPLEKPRLLKAIASCIQQDDHISLREAELFRAVADSLDCPVPPLLASAN